MLLTNKVGTFRYLKIHLAITPTRVGDVALRSIIFGGNAFIERIQAHHLKFTAEDLSRLLNKLPRTFKSQSTGDNDTESDLNICQTILKNHAEEMSTE